MEDEKTPENLPMKIDAYDVTLTIEVINKGISQAGLALTKIGGRSSSIYREVMWSNVAGVTS